MNDEKQSADRDLKYARGNSENPRNKSSREMVVRESSSNAYNVANKNHDNSTYGCELSPGIVSSEISKNNSVSAAAPKEENGVQVSLPVENSSKIEGDAASLFAKKDIGNVVMKQVCQFFPLIFILHFLLYVGSIALASHVSST